MRLIRFDVIDNQTGQYPDCEKIALTEEWAKHLVYCDIDCFAITEEGDLILIDDCNNIAYPPSDRFTVTIDPSTLRPKGEWIEKKKWGFGRWVAWYECSCCGERDDNYEMYEMMPFCSLSNFCPNCGADMRGE